MEEIIILVLLLAFVILIFYSYNDSPKNKKCKKNKEKKVTFANMVKSVYINDIDDKMERKYSQPTQSQNILQNVLASSIVL
jgi:hypothetical protein